MQYDVKLKRGLTAVIITNRKISEIKALEKIRMFTDNIVIVTSIPDESAQLDGTKIIHSRSKNFAYLRNLGAFYADTTHIITIDSDEEPDELLVKEIKQCDLMHPLYNFEVSTYFDQRKMNVTTHLSNKIYDKRCFIFIGSVHEQLLGSLKNPITLKGALSNYSQENWNEWYQKAKRYTSLEKKDFNVLLRALYPILIFFSKKGWRDGILGVRYTIKGIEYIFLVLVRGRRNYMTLSINQINFLIKEDGFNHFERDFISWVIENFLSDDRTVNRMINNLPFADLLEQISSPFILNP